MVSLSCITSCISGEDGRTYQNECVISSHCVRELHRGACTNGQKHDLQAHVISAPGALLLPSSSPRAVGPTPERRAEVFPLALPPFAGQYKDRAQIESRQENAGR